MRLRHTWALVFTDDWVAALTGLSARLPERHDHGARRADLHGYETAADNATPDDKPPTNAMKVLYLVANQRRPNRSNRSERPTAGNTS
jgi:hypothetical protein